MCTILDILFDFSFVCRFLCHVIVARDAQMVIEAESLQNHVIRTWFRCLLQLSPNEESCSTLSRLADDIKADYKVHKLVLHNFPYWF